MATTPTTTMISAPVVTTAACICLITKHNQRQMNQPQIIQPIIPNPVIQNPVKVPNQSSSQDSTASTSKSSTKSVNSAELRVSAKPTQTQSELTVSDTMILQPTKSGNMGESE